MTFHEDAVFPEGISKGALMGPGFNTVVTKFPDSGAEQLISRWSDPLHVYDVRYGIKKQSDLQQLKTFILNRKGSAIGFRFKDWLDYATTPTGSTHLPGDASISATDVIIGAGDGTTETFNLVKAYVDSGGYQYTRRIKKPVPGSVLVAVDGVPLSSGFTVNHAEGTVTITPAPSALAAITAGFLFHVPGRFGESLDRAALISLDNYNAASMPSIPIEEWPDDEGVDDWWNHRGATPWADMTANAVLSESLGLAHSFDPQVSGLKVFLPSPIGLKFGGPKFVCENLSVTHALDIVDPGGAGTLATINSAQPTRVIFLLKTASVTPEPLWVAA